MSAIEKDFDALALMDDDGWSGNKHYHNWLLRYLPPHCEQVLEVGCGTGAFSRRLAGHARHVTAIDLSSEMIRVARARSTRFTNIDFEIADVIARELPESYFDCIASIATLHHVPIREVVAKLKQALRPGGTLIVLDLCEPERGILTTKGFADAMRNLIAMGASCSLCLFHNGRLRPPAAVRAAWEAHGKTDSYLTMDEVHALIVELLPGAVVQRHLLWRYSLVWRKT
ncbi:MAG TPA: class I SAM-dependent methyltransferase [Pyrinomonadaceae bacterium]|jgi:SAM-dependent methyltransferase|nr:class I SAM-dependent methyltransferase [Pyrinomonadaceae bacterium]